MYSKINNYRENALNVIKEMVRQVGTPSFNDEGNNSKGSNCTSLIATWAFI